MDTADLNRQQLNIHGANFIAIEMERKILADRIRELESKAVALKPIVNDLMNKLGLTSFPIGICMVVMDPLGGPRVHRFCSIYGPPPDTEDADGFPET